MTHPRSGAMRYKRSNAAQRWIAKAKAPAIPLREAAFGGQLNFAELLPAHGAQINAKDDNGKTPLAIALEYKRNEVAAFWRKHGGKE
jgi:ankyrin repeat protein